MIIMFRSLCVLVGGGCEYLDPWPVTQSCVTSPFFDVYLGDIHGRHGCACYIEELDIKLNGCGLTVFRILYNYDDDRNTFSNWAIPFYKHIPLIEEY